MPNRKLLSEVCGNATSCRYTHRKHPPHVSRPVIANWLDSHVIYQTLSGAYIVTSIFAFLCQKLSDWGHIVFFPLNPPTCLCLTLRHCWSNSSMLFFFLGGGWGGGWCCQLKPITLEDVSKQLFITECKSCTGALRPSESMGESMLVPLPHNRPPSVWDRQRQARTWFYNNTKNNRCQAGVT